MIESLWNSEDPAAWAHALAAYPEVVARRGPERLVEIDDWYRHELPLLLAARPRTYLTFDELMFVAEWKMRRGVHRGRNLALVEKNAPGDVRAASETAFAAVPDPRKPLVALTLLTGVGPATASAVLAAARPDLYPYFDELVALQLPSLGTMAFTLPCYVRYAESLRARAARLAIAASANVNGNWTAHAVAQALWSAVGGSGPAARPQ